MVEIHTCWVALWKLCPMRQGLALQVTIKGQGLCLNEWWIVTISTKHLSYSFFAFALASISMKCTVTKWMAVNRVKVLIKQLLAIGSWNHLILFVMKSVLLPQSNMTSDKQAAWHAYTHARAHTHTHTHTHMRACMHARTPTHTHTCTRAHTHASARAHTHTHSHEQTDRQTDTHTHLEWKTSSEGLISSPMVILARQVCEIPHKSSTAE